MIYRKEIDGLRALAVLPVLFFHAGFDVFSGGYVGVDIFFVISGFLISSIILKEKAAGEFNLLRFYERRARRILPALFFVVLCCIPISIFYMWPEELKSFFSSVFATSIFSSNILFYLQSGYFETSAELKPLLHTWSLAVEEQFYIIFPVFVMLFWRFGFKNMVIFLSSILILSLLLSQWASIRYTQANFYLPVMRAWELLVGVLCAFYIHKKGSPLVDFKAEILSIIGFAGVLIGIFTFDKGTPFPGFYALLPVGGTALILLYANQGSVLAKFLSFPVFVWIGLISYSVYLWHHPLFAFARIINLNEPTVYLYSFLIFLSLGLAYISWRFIEKPFRQKNRFDQKQIFQFSIVGILSLIIIGLIGYFTTIFERPMSDVQYKIYKIKGDKTSFYTLGGKKCSDANQCIIGDTSKVPSIALIGDSHAGHLIYNLDEVFLHRGLSAKTMSDADIYLHKFPKFYPKHEKFNVALKKRKEFVFSDDVDTVILSGRYTLRILRTEFDNQEGGIERLQTANDYHGYTNEQQEIIKNSVKEAIQELLQNGKKVILVYPIPEVGWDVPNQYLKISRYMNPKDLENNFESLVTTSYEVYKERHQQTIHLFDSIQHPNLKRVYPDKFFCDTVVKDRCVTVKSGNLLYVDDDHLSIYGARFIVNDIAKFLKKKK